MKRRQPITPEIEESCRKADPTGEASGVSPATYPERIPPSGVVSGHPRDEILASCSQEHRCLRSRGSPKDAFFRNSLRLHSALCANSQLVFLHEILHSFGSGHEGGVAFEDRAHGFSVEDVVATLMGCGLSSFPDPGDTDCLHVLRFSDPDDSFAGMPIGDLEFQ